MANVSPPADRGGLKKLMEKEIRWTTALSKNIGFIL